MIKPDKYREAQSLYQTGNADQRYVLERLWPELRESDDERIRKDIIQHFAKGIEGSSFDEVREKYKIWLAWLEKQGERKTPQWMIDFLDNYRRKIGCSLDYDEARDVDGKILCIKEWLEKQGEQKPDDKVEPKFKTGDRVIGVISGMPYFITKVCDDHYNTESGCIIMFCAQDNFKLYEQKAAWSEEDESIISELISLCIVNAPDTWCKYSDWLKSLKDRVQPQPKQEWSGEDEVKINRIVACLENLNVADNDILLKDVDWLKSLRPRSQWKPSDEQMEELGNCIHKAWFNKDTLVTLYNELMKL